jgi:hypothetical protein
VLRHAVIARDRGAGAAGNHPQKKREPGVLDGGGHGAGVKLAWRHFRLTLFRRASIFGPMEVRWVRSFSST